MKYLLLTKWNSPGGIKTDWEVFKSKKEAQTRLRNYQKQTEDYLRQGFYFNAPMLGESLILRVEEVIDG